MSNPFTPVTPYEPSDNDGKFLPIGRCRNKLMIVRPLKYEKDGFKTKHHPDGTDVVIADVAVLDAIPPAVNDEEEELPGFEAGSEFRNQAILQLYLKGTFKHYVGKTLIGTVYSGPKTKGKAPIMWRDLSGEPQAVARGQSFLAARPGFLVPVEPQETAPAADPWAAPAGDPWAQPAAQPRSTLEQMRAAASVNHHGSAQSVDAPF